jgi:hypothetical protein
MWPASAPPIGSVWDAQSRALTPRGRVVIDVPKAAASRPAPSANRTKVRRPRPIEDGYIRGLATRFRVWHSPRAHGEEGAPLLARVALAKGALDRFFARLDRGTVSVGLWFQHFDGSETASTRDGSLRVEKTEKGVWFEVRPTTADGRLAIRCARRLRTCRSVSIGYVADDFELNEFGASGPQMLITRASLTEISLVESGACPGVWCEVG